MAEFQHSNRKVTLSYVLQAIAYNGPSKQSIRGKFCHHAWK